MKKTLSKLLVVGMLTLSSLGILTAQAATTNVTIQNTPSVSGVSIAGNTYEIYQIFEGTQASSISIGTGFADFFVGDKTDGNGTVVSFGAVSSSSTATVLTALSYVESFGSNPSALASMLKDYVVSGSVAATVTTSAVPALADGLLTEQVITPVAYGYYLVLDSAVKAGTTDGAVAAASLMLLDGEAGEGTITVKATAPTVNKEVWHDDVEAGTTTGAWDDVSDYEIGETAAYRITSALPGNLDAYTTYTYTLVDVMSDGITYNGDVAVYTDSACTVALDASYLTILQGETLPADVAAGTIFQITVDVKAMRTAGLDTTTIYTHYTGLVVDTTDGEETNTVTLTYSNNPYGDGTGTTTDQVKTFGFDLDVFKTDEAGNALAGATFGLYRADGTQIFLVQGEDMVVTAEDGLTTTIPTYKPGTGEASDTAGVVVTGANGLFHIDGLDDATVYNLKEIVAPEGYNVADPVIFEIVAIYANGILESVTVTEVSHVSVTDGQPNVTIMNTKSRLLPETGGMGTTLFHVTGAVTMMAALVLLVSKAKKSHAQ